MKNRLVSIIIPAYNCANFIDQTIDSILNQSYQHFEILICDDCSRDNTFDILTDLKNKDERIRIYRNKQNLGKVLTVNKLILLAKGDYITILDADDYFSIDKIDLQVSFLNKNPHYGLCGCNYASVDISGNTIKTSQLPLSDTEIREHIKNHSLKDFAFCCASIMVPAKIAKETGGYRTFFIECCIGEDIDWILRILEKYPVANINCIGYYYRFHSSSLTRVVHFSIKHRHMHDIVAFLAEQRLKTGEDLISTGNKEEYRQLIDLLSKPYKEDKGLLYRKVIIEYAINKNRKQAKMYFQRLRKIQGCNIKTIKIWFMMQILLLFKYEILLKIRNIFGLYHLSSYA